MSRRIRQIFLLLAFAAVVAPLACKRGGAPNQGTSFVEVRMADLPAQVQATGTVTPRVGAQVKVGPRVSGKLEHLYVKVGDQVEKGQVLAEVESRDLQAGVTRARASLRDAQAGLSYADANYKRQLALVKDGIVSADQIDVTKKALESAEAQVKNSQAALEQAMIGLSYATVTAPIKGTVASVATQEGETVAAQLAAPTFVTLVDLGRLEVDAYVDEVDIGRVKVGQSATFTVDAYPDKVFQGVVDAIYPQAVIQDNVVNYPVIVRIEGERAPESKSSEPERRDGTPGSGASPSGEGQARHWGPGGTGPHPGVRPPGMPPGGRTGSLPGRDDGALAATSATLSGYEGLLRPQMTASVTVLLDTLRGALVIPVRAVKRESGQAYVMVQEGGKPVRRPVTLGREAGDMVQVKAGLSQGDKVAVAQARSEGMP